MESSDYGILSTGVYREQKWKHLFLAKEMIEIFGHEWSSVCGSCGCGYLCPNGWEGDSVLLSTIQIQNVVYNYSPRWQMKSWNVSCLPVCGPRCACVGEGQVAHILNIIRCGMGKEALRYSNSLSTLFTVTTTEATSKRFVKRSSLQKKPVTWTHAQGSS